MVAAAGTVEGMARKYSVPLLVFTALSLLAVIPLREARNAIMHAQLDRSPDVLAHESRSIAAQFGYTDRPADSAVWPRSLTRAVSAPRSSRACTVSGWS